MEQLMQWRTEKRRICDLIPMDSNPRYLKEKLLLTKSNE